MSDTGSASRSDHSSGFERFWKKSKSPSPLQFVDERQAVSERKGSKERSRVSRIFSRASTSAGQSDDSKSDRRRQQVYSAQKRHRNRKDEYIKNLEAELEKLRSLDSAINTERANLEHANHLMRKKLAEHTSGASSSLEDRLDVAFATSSLLDDGEMAFADVFIRRDPQTQHERLFVQDVTMTEASDSYEDSWIAMDFILALEWPCWNHHPHPITSRPNAAVHKERKPPEFGGHSMTMTSAVLSSIQDPAPAARSILPADRDEIAPEILKKWKLPHSEIDKLVKLAERLPVGEDVFTPAQAYAAAKEQVPDPTHLKMVLERLKLSLADVSDCEGFGATMPVEKFFDRLNKALVA